MGQCKEDDDGMLFCRGLCGTLKRVVRFFEEGCGTLKRVMWYFEEGDVVLMRLTFVLPV